MIFVGDASMSPYEIAQPGGSVEHWNAGGRRGLAGARARAMAERRLDQSDRAAHWGYTHSIGMIRQIFGDRMYPLTLAGLEAATRQLSRKH